MDLENTPCDLIEPPIEVFEEDNDQSLRKLSYKQVKEWQKRMHPRHPETKLPFNWFSADISYLPVSSYFIKKEEWVTEEAKQIGLGATLYLHTMKALAYLFLFFSLINIPLFMFYVNGQGPQALAKVQSGQFTDYLSRLAVGNLGVSGFTCSNFNIAKN